MKLQNGDFVYIHSENVSDKDKQTAGGISLKVEDVDGSFITTWLTRQEAVALAKKIRERR